MRHGNSRRGASMMKRWLPLTALLMTGMMLWASAANAQLTINQFGVSLTSASSLQSSGSFLRQAGSHPDFITEIGFNEVSFKTVDLELPSGLLANPTAVATCSFEQITSSRAEEVSGGHAGGTPDCPVASQVGLVQLFDAKHDVASTVGLFNMPHPSNAPALLAFNVGGVITKIEPRMRPSDYGIDADTENIGQGFAVPAAEVRIWGVPADPIHDSERINPATAQLQFITEAEPRPFMIAPTSCVAPAASFNVSSDSWWAPGAFATAAVNADPAGTPFLFEGCNRLRFEPSARAEIDSRAAASPVGLTFSLTVPQNEAPTGLSTPDVKRAVVQLPAGISVSSSVAKGLGACGLAEIGLGSNGEPTCPVTSRIGSVEVKSPLLDETLDGEIIAARQNENPFNSLLALYMVVRGPGILLKLPGRVTPNQTTGQLTVEFDNTPQLPFETLKVELQGGARAPLVSPATCGTYSAHAELTSWASITPVKLDVPMTFTQNCTTGGFAPRLKAGTASSSGGSFSPFTLQVTQQDGETNLSRIDATLPPGLLAKLAGVPLCGDAQAGSGSCPAVSQVGTTTVGVGAGTNPIYVPEVGKTPTAVYLAGPYKGAPYSLVVKVPAQAGPFDLGTVVVRNALRVDPTTTQVTAESDPLPQILEGIPITYRDVRVEINRNDFTVNPTNCSQFQVAATLTSAAGQTATPNAPFAAANCERLGFKPALTLQMKGQTKRAGNPALTATLKAPAGQANIADTTVILPKTVFIDQRHVSNPCTMVQFNAKACPAKSVLGRAAAYSPLLDKPLEGPVYFRSNGGARKLPDIVADLNGQIHVVLVGFIDSKKVGKETSLVRTRFASVPDAPVSKFVLALKGGKRSLIQNSANLCKVRPKAEVKMTGQNGKTNDFMQKISVKCGKAKKSKKGNNKH
jgi:hypothetical protein